ncbi:MAG: hypothetical protein GF393_00850 [Armatimonadia bacterium]|nr:hypothetical protein [Armatimonadia bacterium]
MAAEQVEIAEEMRPSWWPMVGVHAGLITVIFGAVYTTQVQGAVTKTDYAGYALIGLALVLMGAIRAIDIRSTASRGLLALGGAVALYLAYDPQLGGLPGGAAIAESPVGQFQPSVAHFGVVVAGLALALQAAVDRRSLPREVPFRRALLAGVVLLLALMAVMWGGLRSIYDLSMTASPGLLVFRTIAYGLLMFVCLTIPGVRGAGRAPHIYLGLALIGAVARNLLVT